MPSSSSARSSQSLRSSAAAAVSTSSGAADQPSVPIEILVEHLLAAKRSLSSMTLVLEANDLTTQARSVHEDSVVLAARTAFLRAGIAQQIHTLERIRRGLARTYDVGRRDFEQLIKVLDDAGERLTRTMNVLHNTIVDPVFRPAGEEPRSLMFFVDEGNVDRLTKSLKESIAELKVCLASYFTWIPMRVVVINCSIRLPKHHMTVIFCVLTTTSAPSRSICSQRPDYRLHQIRCFPVRWLTSSVP